MKFNYVSLCKKKLILMQVLVPDGVLMLKRNLLAMDAGYVMFRCGFGFYVVVV